MNVYRVMTMELGKERKWADFATFDGARSCRTTCPGSTTCKRDHLPEAR